MAIVLPKLKFTNFTATPELLKKMKRSLERLTDLSPSDSYVRATMVQNAAGYSCEITVNSTQKRWNVLKAGKVPAEALMNAVGSVLNDLTLWKKDRFN